MSVLKTPFTADTVKDSIIREAEASTPTAVRDGPKLFQPKQDPYRYLELEICTPKLDRIHNTLWLAGLPQVPRPLHRQKLIGREIWITENPDEHLVWFENRIFIKPLPPLLLCQATWDAHLNHDTALHASACGMLFSYACLVGRRSDFAIAQQLHLIPTEFTYEEWSALTAEVLASIDLRTLQQVSKRYQYGELRLSRLNLLYRISASTTFMRGSTWQRDFFQKHFGWLVATFAYFSVVLSAMQVGLGTQQLALNAPFQRASYGFTTFSLVAVVASVLALAVVWSVLFWYHLLSTIRFVRRTELERRQR